MNRAESYLGSQAEQVPEGLKQKAVRGATVTILSRLAEHGIHLISVVVLARLLTPKDFGLIAMVASVGSIFNVFRDLGLSDATIQAPRIEHRQVSTLFWVNAVFGAGISILFIACSPLIAWFFKEPALTMVSIFFSISFVFVGLAIQHMSLMKRKMEFTRIAVISVVSASVSVAAAIAAAALGFGYWAIVVRQVVLSVGLALGAWIGCRWRPGRPAPLRSVLPMIKFGGNIIGVYVLTYFTKNMDNALIGWRFGAKPLGFYDRGYQLSVMPADTLALPVQGVAVSTLSKLRSDPAAFRRYYLNAMSVLAFIGMPLSAFLAVSSRDIIRILLGAQWEGTAGIFVFLSMGIGMQIVYATIGWLHISLGRTDRWAKWALISTPIILLAYVAGLGWGGIGVAIWRTAVFTLLLLPSLWYAGKPVGLKASRVFSEIWRYCLCALMAGLLHHYVVSPHLDSFGLLLRLCLSIGIFSLVYVVLIIGAYRGLGPIRGFLSLIRLSLPRS